MADSRLEGVAELSAALHELGVSVQARELRGTVKDALEIAEHRARSLMPRGTQPHKTYRGRLVSPGFAISTLHIETWLNKRTGSAVAGLGVEKEAFYATVFVELGTAHMPAQPWLRPAFESSESEMLGQIGTSLKQRIEKVRAKANRKSQQRAVQRRRLARR